MGIRNAEREYAMGKRESAMVNGNTQCRTRIRYGKWEYAMPNANTLWENANQKVTFSATILHTVFRELAVKGLRRNGICMALYPPPSWEGIEFHSVKCFP